MAKARVIPTPIEHCFADLLGFIYDTRRYCTTRELPLSPTIQSMAEDMQSELRQLAGDHANGISYMQLTSRSYARIIRDWFRAASGRSIRGHSNSAISRFLIRAMKRGNIKPTLRRWGADGWIARGKWQLLDEDTRRWLQAHVRADDTDLRYFYHSWERFVEPASWAQLAQEVRVELEPVGRQFAQRFDAAWSLCLACPEGEERLVPRWGNTKACLRCRRRYGTQKRLWSIVLQRRKQRQDCLDAAVRASVERTIRGLRKKRERGQ